MIVSSARHCHERALLKYAPGADAEGRGAGHVRQEVTQLRKACQYLGDRGEMPTAVTEAGSGRAPPRKLLSYKGYANKNVIVQNLRAVSLITSGP